VRPYSLKYQSFNIVKILKMLKILKGFRHIVKRKHGISRKSLAGLLLLLIVVGVGFFFFHNIKKAAAEWFDQNWFYRKSIILSRASGAVTNYQMKLTVSYGSGTDSSSTVHCDFHCNADFSDLRFTTSDGTTLLDYWVESYTASSVAAVWVEFDSIGTGATTFYIYYGNGSAASASNGANTFLFFDDFSSLNTGVWNNNKNTPTVSDGVLSLDYDDGISESGSSWGYNVRLRQRVKQNLTTAGRFRTGFSDALLPTVPWNNDAAYLLFDETDQHLWGFNINKPGSDDGGSIYPFAADTWYVNDIKRISGSVTYDINGVSAATLSTNAPTANLYVYSHNGTSGGIDYMDWIFVGNYVTPEPVWGVWGFSERSSAPVAYWKFDEGQGQTAYDESSNNNDGILGSTTGSDATDPIWQTEDMCVTGKCLKFDGTNDYVAASDSSSLSPTSAVTVQTWIKSSTGASGIGVITKGPVTSDYDYMLYLSNSGMEVDFYMKNSVGTSDTAGSVVFNWADGLWHHYSAVFDGDWIHVYIDGILRGSNNTALTDIRNSTNPLLIGKGWSNEFNGFLDDVQIYPYARSSDQIKADYNAGKSGAGGSGKSASFGNKTQDWMSNGLVGYWKMDEATGSGAILTDSSGNGNNGTAKLYGGGNTATDSAHLAGKYGNGFSFDGGDDRLEGGDVMDMGTNDMTISAWIKTNGAPTSANYTIVSKSIAAVQDYRYRVIIDKDSGTAGMFMQGNTPGSDVDFYGSKNVSDNAWHFVTYVFDRDANASIYVDGAYDTSAVISQWNGLNMNSTNPFRIGAYTAADGVSASMFFKGSIDEVRVYSRALSPKEVSDLYNWAPGPVGWWKMDENVSGDAKTLADFSGYGNNAQTSDGPNNEGMNCKIIGKYGTGCLFDGLDDYASVTNNSSLNIVYAVTMEAWVKLNNNGSAGRGTWQFVVGKASSSPRNGYNLHFADSTRAIVLELYNNDVYHGTSTNKTDWQPGVWYHIAGTYEFQPAGSTTNNLKIYVNGELDKQAIDNNFALGTNSNALYIGASDYDNYYIAGAVDDVRVYNYARTQKQIMEDMNAGHPSVGSPLGSYAGYWKFDEGYGTTTFDNSINKNNGTISGAVWTNNGKFGKALGFNGSSSYVDVGHNASLEMGTHDISISAWIKTNSTSDQAIIYKGGGDPTDEGYFFWYYPTNGDLRFYLSDGATRIYPDSDDNLNINDGNWHHVVVSVNRSGSVIFYKDGRSVGSFDISSSFVGTDITNSGVNLDIGWVPAMVFNGLIDEVKIYPFALTADEVKMEYNQGKAIVMGSVSDTSGLAGGSVASNSASAAYCIPGDTASCAPPVGEWKMDEHTGTSANDTSGNNNNGNLGGGTPGYRPAWQSSSACHSGSCLKFDGTDDYVDMGDVSGLHVNGKLTIEAWIKTTNTSKGEECIILQIGATADRNYQFYVEGGYLKFLHGNHSISEGISSLVNIADGTWKHVVFVADYPNYYFYINGVQVRTGSMSFDVSYTIVDEYRIGGISSTYQDTIFDGFIDDVKIFNYARTPAQIAWDYNRGKPVGYWKFDECQGATAYDTSGNGNNGTIAIGGTAPQTTAGTCLTPTNGTGAWYNGRNGKYNSAMSFDGVDDYVNMGDVLDIHKNDLTVEAWIKPSTVSPATNVYAVGKSDTGIDDGRYAIGMSTDGHVRVVFDPGNGLTFNSNATLTAGVWTHVVAVYDRDVNLSIYINGVYDTGQSIASGNGLDFDNGLSFLIGSYMTTLDFFPGLIDEVKIYNYALTPVQIKVAYNQGAAVRFAPWRCGDNVAFTYKGSKVTYGTVSSQNECWMDRNLGASQVATAYNDANAYGDLFQWGRLADGHQARTSGLTTTGPSTTDNPGHSNFIYGAGAPAGNDYDWRSGHNDNLWQEVSRINNPCPSGWRVPMESEWTTERSGWIGQNYTGAYASPLKLTAAGFRWSAGGDGNIYSAGTVGYYWTSSLDDPASRRLQFDVTNVNIDGNNAYRSEGYSVRCIKN
jgi:uncharacterized protein (TIGR02145 family)